MSVISKAPASPQEMLTYQGAPKAALTDAVPYYKVIVMPEKRKRLPSTVWQNVAPLRGEHGSAAASTVFKIQPHLNADAV